MMGAINDWEALVEEHDSIAVIPMPDNSKLVNLQSILPRDLEDKVVVHPSYDKGYDKFREHVNAVITRLGGKRTAAAKATPAGPSPGGHVPAAVDHTGGENVPEDGDEDLREDGWEWDDWALFVLGKGAKGPKG